MGCLLRQPSRSRSLRGRRRVGGDRQSPGVSRGATYRIRGSHHGREINLGPLWARDLETGPDGSFEIIAGPDEHPGNWIPLDPGNTDVTRVPDIYPMAWGALGG